MQVAQWEASAASARRGPERAAGWRAGPGRDAFAATLEPVEIKRGVENEVDSADVSPRDAKGKVRTLTRTIGCG